jgi:uncharacterized protein
MRIAAQLTNEQARWLAIDAQGLAKARPKGNVGRTHLRSMIDAIGQVQLDAINVVTRTQFLVPFSRLGGYDITHLHNMTGPGGEWFEYWGHAASIMPVGHQPHFRWRMALAGPYGERPLVAKRRAGWWRANKSYVDAIRREISERGALTAGQLTDPRRRAGEWWDRRSHGRVALEMMFARGEVAAWRTAGFERVYDLPERVLPDSVLRAPTPTREEAQRALLLVAARALGVATMSDLASYYVLNTKHAKPRVAELVDAGELLPVTVEGWRDPAYTLPGARPHRPRRENATLLSPFDSLIWERARTSRLFAFDYRIEVYVPEPQRQYGYYVLPLLLGDEIVGRFDLKADRKTSRLLVRAAHAEPGEDSTSVAAAAAPELDALRSWLGLDGIAIGPRGNLATALRRAAA